MNALQPMLLCLVLGAFCAAPPCAGQTQAQQFVQEGYKYHTGEGAEKDSKRALAYYLNALEQAPELFEAHYNAGLIYQEELKDYRRAQGHFTHAARAARALKESSSQYEAMARNGLGTALHKMDKLDLAEQQFDVAARMYPQLVEAHYNLINLLLQQGKLEEARRAVQIAEQVAPSSRYEIFKGRLKAKEQREGFGAVGGALGLAVFAGALVLYALHLRRKVRRR